MPMTDGGAGVMDSSADETMASAAPPAKPEVPFGEWPSPISSADVARSGRRLSFPTIIGGDVWWQETQPDEGGRVAVMCQAAGGRRTALLPAPWNARTPRDLGAAWDFDDVRDHYLGLLFRIDPSALRSADPERYLALSRVVSGEVMANAFAEWRRQRSSCRGALVWFWRDLWSSAGWGVIDARGKPKAAYRYLARALQPVAIFMSDESGNGLVLHVANEQAAALHARIELALYRRGELRLEHAGRDVEAPPRTTLELAATDFFDGWYDLNYAYRFGPPSHDLVVARLLAADGACLSEAFFFPLGLPNSTEAEVGLTAIATARAGGEFELKVATRRFAQSVSIEAAGFEAGDDYFHLAPGATRTILLRPAREPGPQAGSTPGASARSGSVRALNSTTAARIQIP